MMRNIGLALLAIVVLAGVARGQEAIVTPCPVQPGQGRFTIAERFRYLHFGEDPVGDRDDIDQFEMITTFQAGLTHDLALSFELPVVVRSIEHGGAPDDETLEGIGDMTALVRWRLWQNDFGPVDTARLGLNAGLRIGSGNDAVSDDDVDPVIGMAFMLISGRHGLNIGIDWTFTTDGVDDPIMPGDGEADLGRASAAYLFRLAPEQYTPETDASWYAVVEVQGLYETNGDHEIFIAPGLLYEARRWAAELSVLLPVSQDLDERPEADIGVIAGVRFIF